MDFEKICQECKTVLVSLKHAESLLNEYSAQEGCYGVEAIRNPDNSDEAIFLYANAGDLYTETLVYDVSKERLFLGCYADAVEEWGRPDIEKMSRETSHTWLFHCRRELASAGPCRASDVGLALLFDWGNPDLTMAASTRTARKFLRAMCRAGLAWYDEGYYCLTELGYNLE